MTNSGSCSTLAVALDEVFAHATFAKSFEDRVGLAAVRSQIHQLRGKVEPAPGEHT